MSRIKDPNEKKRTSLERDHRTFALEGNKSFRTAWPLKKARANRKFRRAGTTALAEAVLDDSGDVPASPTAKPTRSLEKYGVMSLAQSISVKSDESGLRWNTSVLEKNPDTLEASNPLAKPKRKI